MCCNASDAPQYEYKHGVSIGGCCSEATAQSSHTPARPVAIHQQADIQPVAALCHRGSDVTAPAMHHTLRLPSRKLVRPISAFTSTGEPLLAMRRASASVAATSCSGESSTRPSPP